MADIKEIVRLGAKKKKPYINDIAINKECEDIANNIRGKFDFVFNDITDLAKQTVKLKTLYKQKGEHLRNINYDLIYREFNSAFLLKNCFKTVVSLHYLKQNHDISDYSIVDIGSGAGSFYLAYKSVYKKTDNIIQVEKSENQIALGQILTNNKDRIVHTEFPNLSHLPDNYILTAVYFMCEQQDDAYKILIKQFEHDQRCKGIILVDYQSVLTKFQRLIKYKKTLSWKILFKLSRSISKVVNEKYLTVNGIAIFK